MPATNPFVGQLSAVAFNFAPVGWLDCDGQLLQIAEYETLYTLLGTTYGGDGETTFALPDLRGRVPLHEGEGRDLKAATLAATAGGQNLAEFQEEGDPLKTLPTLAVRWIIAVEGTYPSRD